MTPATTNCLTESPPTAGAGASAGSCSTSLSVRLECADSTDFARSLADESVQLIVSSPPYNIGKEYETRVSIDAYLASQAPLLAELVRALRPDGSICWQVGNYVDNSEVFPLDMFYYPLFKDLGLKLRNRIVWHFGHGLHASRRFSGRYETLLWFTKTDNYVFNLDAVRVPSRYPGKRHHKGPKRGQLSGNPLGKNPSDFWDRIAEDFDSGMWNIPNVKWNHVEKTSHPCQFPVELAERCVLALSNAGDLVVDPYAGVASTLVAAVKHGRSTAGADHTSAYVAIGRERLAMAMSGTLTTRLIGTPVHQPSGKEMIAQVPAEWQIIEGGAYG